MRKKIKKYMPIVMVVYIVVFDVINYKLNNDLSNKFKYYDEVYDVLQNKDDEYTTNLGGIYNEYGIQDLFKDSIAKKEDVEKALKAKGMTDKEIEDIELSAYITDDEMVRHTESYDEDCHNGFITAGIVILFLLIILYILVS